VVEAIRENRRGLWYSAWRQRRVKCTHTIRAALPDIAFHLEVAILGAEMYIGSQHHLHVGLLL
jgi:hypothetical protein